MVRPMASGTFSSPCYLVHDSTHSSSPPQSWRTADSLVIIFEYGFIIIIIIIITSNDDIQPSTVVTNQSPSGVVFCS